MHAPISRQRISADEIAHLGNISFMHETQEELVHKTLPEGRKERHEEKDKM